MDDQMKDTLNGVVRSLNTLAKGPMAKAAQTELAALGRRLAQLGMPDPLSGEWARKRLTQDRGPTVRFTGKSLGMFETKINAEGRSFEGEVFLTQGGAYVAVARHLKEWEPGEVDESVEIEVFPPANDETLRRHAVLAFFQWSDHARSMARKIGWSATWDVD